MKKIHILGGGTQYHVRPHLALSAPAGGKTARDIATLISEWPTPTFADYEVKVHLTRLADPTSKLDTNSDVDKLVSEIIADPESKMVFFSVAMCDFEGFIQESPYDGSLGRQEATDTPSGKREPRLSTRRSDGKEESYNMSLYPAPKVIGKIRETRKDIFLIGFKTTAGATEDAQFDAGLKLCKEAHCNLVLANDVHTSVNMIVTPEQARYSVSTDRPEVLIDLVEMAGFRSKGTFARCKIEDGDLYEFNSPEIPDSLRKVVQDCVDKGAYEPFNGKCVGHFAVKKPDGSVLCSIRRSNYNTGIKMVKMVTLNERETIAYGARPSAGSRSQWIMFNKNPNLDCVVHFHCPLKPGKEVSLRSQKFKECGSNECGFNTAAGLSPVDPEKEIYAVMLDNHGPNILFNSSIDPSKVIEFIGENFDLSKTTRGYSS